MALRALGVVVTLALLASCWLDRSGLAPAPGAGGASQSNASTGGSLTISTATQGAGGAGAAGAGGGGDPLDDESVLVRYFIDEAASGVTPIELIDAAPSPLNLKLTYLGNLGFAEVNGQRGMAWTTAGADDRASVLTDGTKVKTALTGSTAATLEVVLSIQAVTDLSSRIFHIGQDQNIGRLTVASNTVGAFDFRFNDELRGLWTVMWPPPGTRIVLHVVLDTTQAVDADRVRLYADGVPQQNQASAPSQNETIDIPDGEYLVAGNREIGARSFTGALHYAAIYTKALDEQTIAAHVARLTVSDDH